MWSLHAKEGIQYDESNVLIQPFTTEEWNAYPFAGEEKLKWFRDAKLGLFLHVGISALGKVDIGWSRKTHKLPDPGEGPIPDEVYDGWANEIKMEDFDADKWIDLKDNNLVITVPKIEFEDIIVKVQMAHNIQTSIKGISVENSEVTQSHIADIEIIQIQNKE